MEDKDKMKLFIGNLPFNVDDAQLKEIFSAFGEITESVVIIDRNSRRSKGFGFVTFADKASAEKAIAELNGKDFQGRELKVNEAKPMDPNSRPPRRNFGGGGGNFSGGNRRRF